MSNELSTELVFDVEYTPSTINITNEDQLALLINATVQKYDNLIFKDSDIADAKKARTDLKRIFNLIDDKRKEVKRDFNEPLISFEEKIKEYSNEIRVVTNKIDSQIKGFEEKTKQMRKEIILAEIIEQANNYGLEVSEIELKSSWLNSTSFTAKNKLTKKIEQEILAECIEMKQRKEAQVQNKKLVESYAKANKLEPNPWVLLIDEGLTAANIFPKIDEAAKQILEQEQKELEKAEEEIKKVTPVKTSVEVHKELHAEKIEDEPIYSFTLKITGTAKQISVIKKTIEELGVDYEAEMAE